MAVLVKHIVRELEFLERDRLFGELFASEWGVGVHVEPGGERRVGFPGDEPRRPVVRVTVALAVDRYDIHEYSVLGVRLQASEADAESREHAPGTRDGGYLIYL